MGFVTLLRRDHAQVSSLFDQILRRLHQPDSRERHQLFGALNGARSPRGSGRLALKPRLFEDFLFVVPLARSASFRFITVICSLSQSMSLFSTLGSMSPSSSMWCFTNSPSTLNFVWNVSS